MGNRMKRIAALSAVLAAMAVIGLAPTAMEADHRSDAVVSIAPGPAAYAGILQFSPIGQTFVHPSSSLGSIAVYLQVANESAVTANLWIGSINALDGLVATEAKTVPAGEGWVDFDFDPDVAVGDPTQVYVLELEASSVVPRWRQGVAYADGQVVSPLLPAFLDFTLETYAGAVNSAPTDIALDNDDVDENDPGAIVGTLTATDPDPADTHTFAVDDTRFEVDTSARLKLKDGVSLDFETEPTVSIDVTATDGGELEFTKMFTIVVNDLADAVGDTTPPTLGQPEDITNVEATGPDGAGVFYDPPAATDDIDPAPTVTCEPGPVSTFSLGTTIVTCTAADETGNESTVNFNVTVVDSTPPDLTVPVSFSVEGDTTGGADVTLPTATATDVVDPAPLVTCDAEPGFFPLGPTTVNCTAADASDNDASGSFNVTVVDTTPPVITPPANIIVEGDTTGGADATNAAIATFLGAASATDVVDPSPDIINDAPALFPLGPNTVTFTATDDEGNFAAVEATVTVVDTTPPALGQPADITVLIESPDGTGVGYALPISTDVVDPDPVVSCLPVTGSTFGLGATVVECTAADDSSNSAMTTLVVTVLGPRDLKAAAIEELAPYVGESRKIAKAVEDIEKSLRARLWTDELHLDIKHGHKVFSRERKAVKELSKLLKLHQDGDDDRGKHRQASDEAKAAAAAAIDLLVSADPILADLNLQEAEAATPLDPKRQKKIDGQLAKADKQLTEGDTDLAAGKPDKAIQHYRKAWKHANSALKQAQKAPKGDDDDD